MNTARLYQSKLTIEKSILSFMQRNSPSYPCYQHGRNLHHSVALQVSATNSVWKGSSTVTSNQWKERQKRDRYVKYAQHHNYRCRSAFKLIEIDDKHEFLSPGSVVIDCGAAPGSWSQVAVQRVNSNATDASKPVGKVLAVDRLHFASVPGATILSGKDFTLSSTQNELRGLMDGGKAHAVISDMAPNATGVRTLDHEQIIELQLTALKFSVEVLRKNGHFLCKIWQGSEVKRLEQILAKFFQNVHVIKPPASRSDSAEVFLLAKKFFGKKP